jgi:hypothetical protein
VPRAALSAALLVLAGGAGGTFPAADAGTGEGIAAEQSRPTRAERDAARERARAERAFDRAFAAAVRVELAATMEAVAGGGSADEGRAATDALLDRVIAWGGPEDQELLRDVVLARRLLGFVATLPADDQAAAAGFLTRVPDTARRLAFLVRPEVDDVPRVMRVLSRLAAIGGDRIDAYADLVAAICVVHDRPVSRRVNENMVSAPPPEAIFEYFVANERRLLNPPRRMPAELLVHVVDVTTSIEDLEWALDRYRNDADIGDRFEEIEYDTAHLRDGRPKMVTRLGLTLPNIKQHGGVCADQAYFAAGVGKAIGVPSAYVSGRSGSNAHAWVGFVRAERGRTAWDFDAGRYEEYQFVRGVIEDPQSGERVPDSHVATLVPVALAAAADREIVVALTDAARRVEELALAGGEGPASWPPAAGPAAGPAADAGGEAAEAPASIRDPRTPSIEMTLELLRAAVERVPSHLEPWRMVQGLAADDRLDLAAKQAWAEAAWRLCGTTWADLFVDVVGPMIDSIDDPGERTALWDVIHDRVRARPDLCAEIRMAQGAVWEEAGELDRALNCYQLVIADHAVDGPPIQGAVRAAMQLLQRGGRGDLVLPLLADVWPRLKRPSGPRAIQFAMADDWVIVGRQYEAALRQAGRGRDAAIVAQQIAGVVR